MRVLTDTQLAEEPVGLGFFDVGKSEQGPQAVVAGEPSAEHVGQEVCFGGELEVLEDDAEMTTKLGWRGDGLPREFNLNGPFGRLEKAAETREQGAFAHAGRTDQSEELAGMKIEIEMPKKPALAAAEAEIPCAEHRRLLGRSVHLLQLHRAHQFEGLAGDAEVGVRLGGSERRAEDTVAELGRCFVHAQQAGPEGFAVLR